MDAAAWAVLGICAPIIVALVGAWVKQRADAVGWRTSYEREKERADRQDAALRDAALATDIATKTAAGLHALMTQKAGGAP